ncbi:YesL family protein [Gracilibacillus kekensis]|uniref:Uncharacterized membrane protein YesL n=1 Tax=Gracilibacillus kekensis TaxID=1027249 RepID=A0A1M7LCG6_9BACI|nr:DUF624 domain-containing protein [Gracilibacillus kekensis]SHM75571.1 Uncharacterized membrane protein YesL [Gracilibacillus kekensis]
MLKLMEWIAKAAGLNMLWILFTLCGFGFFGMFPATIALLMVTRDLRVGNDKRIAKSFLNYYVENFVKANVYGYVFVSVNLVMITLTFHAIYQISLWFAVPIFVVTVLLFIISLYVLPVFTYFKASFLNHVKLATVISLGHPAATFVLFSLFALNFGVIFYSRILIAFPILFMFFMVSLSAYFVMVILLPVFNKYGRSDLLEVAEVNQVSKV